MALKLCRNWSMLQGWHFVSLAVFQLEAVIAIRARKRYKLSEAWPKR